MQINVNDDQFIDLINDTTSHLQDEIDECTSRIDDLESNSYPDQDDLDVIAGELQDLDVSLSNRIDDIENGCDWADQCAVDELESRIDDLENYSGDSEAISTLTEKIFELEYSIEQLQSAVGGMHKRTNYLIHRTLRNRTRRALRAIHRFGKKLTSYNMLHLFTR
jgi:uncharacterized coiled-coil protein SlyX